MEFLLRILTSFKPKIGPKLAGIVLEHFRVIVTENDSEILVHMLSM